MPSAERAWLLQPVLGPRGGVVGKVLVPASEPVIRVPERPKGRQKSNSQRGKEFRAKKRHYEQQLQTMIRTLQREIEDLQCLHTLKQETTLVRPTSTQGSLARTCQVYIDLFQSGTPLGYHAGCKRSAFPDAAADLAARQAAFLHRTLDEECEVIDADGLLDQWQRYTAYHASFAVGIRFLEVLGTKDKPVVRVGVDLTVTYSRATFENVFPHVAQDEEFVQKHTGRVVVYRGVNTFTFSPEGRILIYESDVDFVQSLLDSGMKLRDVSVLMQQALIAEQYRLGDTADAALTTNATPVVRKEQSNGTETETSPSVVVDSDDEVQSPMAEPEPQHDERLDLEFILG